MKVIVKRGLAAIYSHTPSVSAVVPIASPGLLVFGASSPVESFIHSAGIGESGIHFA